jgi:hypothetical protein
MKNRSKTFFSLFVSALVCFSFSSSANAVIYKHRWSGKYLNVNGNPGSNTSVIRGVTLYSGNQGSNLTTDPEQKWNQVGDFLKSFAYPSWCLNARNLALGEQVTIYGCISPAGDNLQLFQPSYTNRSSGNGRPLVQLKLGGYYGTRSLEPRRIGYYANNMEVNFQDCLDPSAGPQGNNQDWEVW